MMPRDASLTQLRFSVTTHRPSQHYRIEGHKGPYNLTIIMPRDASLRVFQKKDTILMVINCFRFKIQAFTSNYLKQEVIHFVFDVLFGPFRETHRVKGCDKNVSLFIIVCRKMTYLLILLKSEFIWPPRSSNLNPLHFYLCSNMI